ncbi:6-phosphofructokinase [Oryzomicrobium terrae]|uniref:Pyrophosphate--fructose 6-phosphate 1-phosphotransferase n=1 Tax=Oryzomicrobium terrae TaxID=1735038 RepID=A0A5C1E9G9_9RHOO|nr:6-phosphofructokinase [Oryzomicrobium terrae]QEL65616.1 6-phosphofructokinase [Oryzomicrobium terrae]
MTAARPRNVLYFQSGGVTAVINATAGGVIDAARSLAQAGAPIGTVLAARNGLSGVLKEELIDTASLSDEAVLRLRQLPGGAFGASRRLLPPYDECPDQWERVAAVLRAHDIGHVLVNGGNGSMETARLFVELGQRYGLDITAVGLPKTVDNDLLDTDVSPGFGSAAKYLATSMREASLDLAAMSGGARATKVFILEVMGRHAGWMALSTALAQDGPDAAPHLILCPEVPFDEERVVAAVSATIARVGYCAITVAEGLAGPDGKPLAVERDAATYGHEQLGGVGPWLADRVQTRLGVKCHCAVADYLQRSARHLASRVDLEQAWAVGATGVEWSLAGRSGVMVAIRRLADAPYRWDLVPAALDGLADRERKVPPDFLSADGLHASPLARAYLAPLIAGEAYPPYGDDGLPDYRWQCPSNLAPRLSPYSL